MSKKRQPWSSQDRHTQGISPPFSLGLTEVLGLSTFGAGWQESDGYCPHLQSHWPPCSRDSHASLSVWMSTKTPDLSLGEPTPRPTQLHPAPVSADLNPFFVPSSHHDSSCFRGKKRFTSGRAVEYVCFLLCSSFCIWALVQTGPLVFDASWGGSHFLWSVWLVLPVKLLGSGSFLASWVGRRRSVNCFSALSVSWGWFDAPWT